MSSKSRPLEVIQARFPPTRMPVLVILLSIATAVAVFISYSTIFSNLYSLSTTANLHIAPFNADEIRVQCMMLRSTPGPSQSFLARDESDRYEPGTNATWIRHAVIFTGEKDGNITLRGDILLDKGIIKAIGQIPRWKLDRIENLTVVDANGAWVTPGLVDLHSHLGVLSSPVLSGAVDLNSPNGPILPWLRSIDGFNTHDEAFELAMAGGVTSAQILPGSGNAIGGQAFMVKLRKTSENSPTSMIIEPPHHLDGSKPKSDHLRWRHLKQACGENLRGYGTRMDSMWALRSAYDEARRVKATQDEYCAKVEAGLWGSLNGPFPENLKWEMLVDVLRGRVKVSNHCYEAVDLDDMVRLSNEFEFHISSFHHASDAWLVPNLLKRAWGGTPAVALFATNHRYKRESFRGSEFASRVLSDAGIPVIMKSDHPVINSRYLIYEAQQAYHFSLPANLALASVTSTPATVAGLSHRIGVLKEGADADVVMWDSHPIQLGATPVRVWIDGISQIPVPSKTGKDEEIEVGKGKEGDKWRQVPHAPNWDKERDEAIRWDGLPPLQGRTTKERLMFTNVKRVWKKGVNGSVEQTYSASAELGAVIVENGKIICTGVPCLRGSDASNIIDLRGGSISPGLMSYGSPLGLEEIAGERSTGDGQPYDAFKTNIPEVLDDSGGVLRAMDALMFGTRNALLAYRSGVTFATSSLAKPFYTSGLGTPIIAGLSTTFRTGSAHVMERGALIQDIVAMHVVLGRPHPIINGGVSVSTQIAGLRRLLYGWEGTEQETGLWFRRAAEGVIPLVIEVGDADIMASLLILKAEVEDKIGSRMRMVFSGATEAHLIAEEIGNSGVGVILNPARPFPLTWGQRRVLPGPPLSSDTALVTLMKYGVTVGLGVREAWEARNTRFDVQWAALESNDRISEQERYALASSNLEDLLGVREIDREMTDMVAYEGGGAFDLSSKVAAVISPERQTVDFF